MKCPKCKAQVAAALENPNIYTVFEVDDSGAQTFIAMSYIAGQSLKHKLKDGPLEVEDARERVSEPKI